MKAHAKGQKDTFFAVEVMMCWFGMSNDTISLIATE